MKTLKVVFLVLGVIFVIIAQFTAYNNAMKYHKISKYDVFFNISILKYPKLLFINLLGILLIIIGFTN